MAVKPYNINPGTRGVNGFALQAETTCVQVQFDANVEATYTVPGTLPLGQIGMIGQIEPGSNPNNQPTAHNKYIAVFRYGKKVAADVVVAVNATAALPTTNAFAANTGELFPEAYNVKAGDVIHAISDTNDMTMSIAIYHIVE